MRVTHKHGFVRLGTDTTQPSSRGEISSSVSAMTVPGGALVRTTARRAGLLRLHSPAVSTALVFVPGVEVHSQEGFDGCVLVPVSEGSS